MYENLTMYLEGLEPAGEMPRGHFIDLGTDLIIDMMHFESTHPELGFGDAEEVLLERGIDVSGMDFNDVGHFPASDIDVSSADGQTVVLLLFLVTRTRFDMDVLWHELEHGTTVRAWLGRLAELDAEGDAGQDPNT